MECSPPPIDLWQATDASVTELAERASGCRLCGLRAGASGVVFGEGHPQAEIMIIGEGPGADEDRLGRPFVGRAGRLLDDIIAAAGLRREDLYITNVVKCRPPGNRNPSVEESRTCFDWLKAQLRLVDPLLVVLLGRVPANMFLGPNTSIKSARGGWHWWEGYLLRVTYHPAALLRDPSKKKPTWVDVQAIMAAHELLLAGTGGARGG